MRIILFTLFILNSALSFSQQAEFKFKDKVVRVGKVAEGELVNMVFRFSNTGDAPLIINDYKVACTCTKVFFPTEPILPGSENEIKVTFDTNGKIAYQDRSITLLSNASNSPTTIRFTINVKNE